MYTVELLAALHEHTISGSAEAPTSFFATIAADLWVRFDAVAVAAAVVDCVD